MSDAAAAPAAPVRPGDAYAMIAQACAIAVQDAVAFLRSTETMTIATMGLAQEIAVAMTDSDAPSKIILAAQAATLAAAATLESVGKAAASVLDGFPWD